MNLRECSVLFATVLYCVVLLFSITVLDALYCFFPCHGTRLLRVMAINSFYEKKESLKISFLTTTQTCSLCFISFYVSFRNLCLYWDGTVRNRQKTSGRECDAGGLKITQAGLPGSTWAMHLVCMWLCVFERCTTPAPKPSSVLQQNNCCGDFFAYCNIRYVRIIWCNALNFLTSWYIHMLQHKIAWCPI